MLGIKRTGAFFLLLFVLTQSVILAMGFINIVAITPLMNFFFAYTDGVGLTLAGHLFLWIGLFLLIVAMGLAYFRFGISYVPAFLSAISLGVLFSLSFYLTIFIGIVP